MYITTRQVLVWWDLMLVQDEPANSEKGGQLFTCIARSKLGGCEREREFRKKKKHQQYVTQGSEVCGQQQPFLMVTLHIPLPRILFLIAAFLVVLQDFWEHKLDLLQLQFFSTAEFCFSFFPFQGKFGDEREIGGRGERNRKGWGQIVLRQATYKRSQTSKGRLAQLVIVPCNCGWYFLPKCGAIPRKKVCTIRDGNAL